MTYSEVDIDEALVKRLLATQFPQWANLPIQAVKSAGTDNAIYKLGNDMAIRLPRFSRVADHIEKEHKWLPILAPFLPLIIHTPIAKGRPAEGYPWNWSIYKWIDGETATLDHIADLGQAAITLGQFITALQKIDTSGGPLNGENDESRGVPLALRDSETRAAIKALDNIFDASILTAIWEESLHVSIWQGAPVWLHGDLQSGNLLAKDGKLIAVIDFGLMVLGDPACDVMVAWTLFSKKTRPIFRKQLTIDEATWKRARGWALSWGLIALSYYLEKNLILAGIAGHTIEEVLSDHK